MNKINHTRMFLNALRTAVIFVSGFLIYEMLLTLEKIWNTTHPHNKLQNFIKRKTIKFIFILIIDLLILYILFFLTGEHF